MQFCLRCIPLFLLTGSALAYNQAVQDPRLATANLWELPLETLMTIPVATVASGTQTPADKSAATVTVITADDIARMGATDLDHALAGVPGLHIGRSDQAYSPRYVFRGISSTHNPEALLMINGIPVKTLFTGSRSQVWAGMPVRAIKRVEVIRGPGSALYGADAFAGVINIITRSGRDTDPNSAGLLAGSFNTSGGWVSQKARLGELQAGLTLEHEHTDGFRTIVRSDLQSVLDPRVSLAPGPVNVGREATDLRLDLQAGPWQYRLGYQFRDDVGTSVGVAQALDPSGQYRSRRFNTDLSYSVDDWRPDWDIKAQLSYYHNTQEVRRNSLLLPPGAFGGAFPDGVIGNPSYKENQARADLNLAYDGFDDHILRLGAGFFWGDIYQVTELKNFDPALAPLSTGLTDVSDTDQVFLHENQRTARYLYGQDEWRLLPRLVLTTGLRLDDYSDFGSTLNPRMALVREWQPGLTSRLLYGRAFHAPSFVDLYATNNPVARGNPDLKPETLDNWELGLHHQPAPAWHYDITLYRWRIQEAINYVDAQAANTGGKSGHGVELEFAIQVSAPLQLAGNYSYQHATVDSTGADVAMAPHRQAYLRLDWQLPRRWHWNSELQWSGRQARDSGDARPPTHAYTAVNLTWRNDRLWRELGVMLSVRNLFNADIREASPGPIAPVPVAAIADDFPQAGRAVYGEVSWRW